MFFRCLAVLFAACVSYVDMTPPLSSKLCPSFSCFTVLLSFFEGEDPVRLVVVRVHSRFCISKADDYVKTDA